MMPADTHRLNQRKIKQQGGTPTPPSAAPPPPSAAPPPTSAAPPPPTAATLKRNRKAAPAPADPTTKQMVDFYTRVPPSNNGATPLPATHGVQPLPHTEPSNPADPVACPTAPLKRRREPGPGRAAEKIPAAQAVPIPAAEAAPIPVDPAAAGQDKAATAAGSSFHATWNHPTEHKVNERVWHLLLLVGVTRNRSSNSRVTLLEITMKPELDTDAKRLDAWFNVMALVYNAATGKSSDAEQHSRYYLSFSGRTMQGPKQMSGKGNRRWGMQQEEMVAARDEVGSTLSYASGMVAQHGRVPESHVQALQAAATTVRLMERAEDRPVQLCNAEPENRVALLKVRGVMNQRSQRER
jgi:hypothetical protein